MIKASKANLYVLVLTVACAHSTYALANPHYDSTIMKEEQITQTNQPNLNISSSNVKSALDKTKAKNDERVENSNQQIDSTLNLTDADLSGNLQALQPKDTTPITTKSNGAQTDQSAHKTRTKVNAQDFDYKIINTLDNQHVVKDHVLQQPSFKLRTIIDPATQIKVDNSYPISVSNYLSLQQAQDLLLKVSPKLAAGQAAIMANQYQAQAVEGINKPVFFLQTSATAYHLEEDLDLTSAKSRIVNKIDDLENRIPELPITPPISILPDFSQIVDERLPDAYPLEKTDHNIGAGIGMVWPVYTAGRTQALTGLLNARTQEAKADELMEVNELLGTLIERYFKAQLAIIAAYLREDALDTLQQTDHMAKRLYEEGFISHLDRLEAKSALADAQSEAIKAKNNARLAMMALQRLLRTPDRVRPITPLFVSSKPLPDVSYFQQLALQHHPGLLKVAAKQNQAKQLHAVADTGNKPNVLMFGYGKLEKDPNWVAGVSATWKLGGGIDKTLTHAASQAKIRQADLTKIEVSDNLLLLVEKNWHAVNNAQARYQALQSNVDLAKEVLRLKRLGLQEGVNTTLDVVQAQTKYLKARTEQAQAANDYVQALAALLQSSGVPHAFNTYMQAADIHLPTLYDPKKPLP